MTRFSDVFALFAAVAGWQRLGRTEEAEKALEKGVCAEDSIFH